MGNTLWVNIRHGRDIESNEADHNLMYDCADALDQLALELGVRKLSDFFDSTDLEYNFADEGADEEADEAEDLDEETGFEDDADESGAEEGWSAEEAQWFDAREGLTTVESLIEHLRAHPESLRLDEEEMENLLDELDDCQAELMAAAKHGRPFHLAVIL